MSWYQTAKLEKTVRKLEVELKQQAQKNGELLATVSDALSKLRQGALDEAIRILEYSQGDTSEPTDR